MKTLHLRVRQQNESALTIARFLEAHPAVERVFYPGLESHPQHDIARRQMRGFGGVLSFILKGNSFDAVRAFLPRLRFAQQRIQLTIVYWAGVKALAAQIAICQPGEHAAQVAKVARGGQILNHVLTDGGAHIRDRSDNRLSMGDLVFAGQMMSHAWQTQAPVGFFISGDQQQELG